MVVATESTSSSSYSQNEGQKKILQRAKSQESLRKKADESSETESKNTHEAKHTVIDRQTDNQYQHERKDKVIDNQEVNEEYLNKINTNAFNNPISNNDSNSFMDYNYIPSLHENIAPGTGWADC